MQLILLKQTF
ncbi:hypothetical protein CGLO_18353 [Colletotrichum gloeosporioides Cg-14]|uniref:Uncharacterized protein n=1 Tax=Colletotrichum gloeosporioides (strain Cg-14) TaxID=1237896 RepID=T0L4D1_COLGC|nr:hypothetical protein CGLO_18353 [Colletotrichum gloeosporioides Cg-14]